MISPDLPITKSEEDVLNRSNFAKNLAQAVIQCTFPTSFSIGLYGKWGSGKTSLLNMVIEEIENIEESTIILRYPNVFAFLLYSNLLCRLKHIHYKFYLLI